MWKNKLVIVFILLSIISLLSMSFALEESIVSKEDDVWGSGKFPYNFRVIDDKLFVGGNLYNPENHSNSPEKVREYVKLLKDMGVTSFVLLHVPQGSEEVMILEDIVLEEGLIFYKCPMNAEKVPTAEETEHIMELIENKSYVHCNWGADRTGAVIAKYLRINKGYSGYDAWKAVISEGSHSGIIGGLKQDHHYRNLILYFWPEVTVENGEVCRIYNL